MRKIIPLLLLGVLLLAACGRNTEDSAEPPLASAGIPAPNPLPTPEPEPPMENPNMPQQYGLVGIWADMDDIFAYEGAYKAAYIEFYADGTGMFWEGEYIPIVWILEGNRLTIRYDPATSDWEELWEYELGQDTLIIRHIEDGSIGAVFTRMASTPLLDTHPSPPADSVPTPQLPANAVVVFAGDEFIITRTRLHGRDADILRADDRFHDGLMLVSSAGRYGFNDKNWNNIIPPIYAEALPFSEGLAAVRIFDEWTGRYAWGFINTANELVIPAQFDEVRSFSEGLAGVRIGDEWGHIDTSGEFAVPLGQFIGIWAMHRGFAAHDFRDGLSYTARVSVTDNNRRITYFIDKNGEIVIEMAPHYEHGFFHARDFNEGLTIIGNDTLRVAAVMDTGGNIIFEFPRQRPHDANLRRIGDFNEGYAVVAHTFADIPSYVIDRTGNVVFSLEGRDLRFVSDRISGGLIPVQSTASNRFGFLDTTGEVAIPFIFDVRPNDFQSGLSALRCVSHTEYIDKTGEVILFLANEMGREFYDDFALVTSTSGAYLLEIIRR